MLRAIALGLRVVGGSGRRAGSDSESDASDVSSSKGSDDEFADLQLARCGSFSPEGDLPPLLAGPARPSSLRRAHAFELDCSSIYDRCRTHFMMWPQATAARGLAVGGFSHPESSSHESGFSPYRRDTSPWY